MTENKTQPSPAQVTAFLGTVEDPGRRADCEALLALMSRVTGHPPVMWGAGIIGFGSYHYKYESGREGTAMVTGFSPRKSDISIYLMAAGADHPDLLSRLGRHKMGKSCLSVRRLTEVDLGVLEQLVVSSVAAVQLTHGETLGSA